jgi:hypothetical protein
MEDNIYDKDLKIDTDSLDIEWIKQPKTFMKWAKMAIEASDVMDKKKDALEIIEAELDEEARGKLEGEKKKIREAMVTSEIKKSERYQKAQLEYRNARRDYKILDKAVEAFNQRKTALENLVDLWQGGYYSTPRSPVGKDLADSAIDRTSEAIRERMNRRRK